MGIYLNKKVPWFAYFLLLFVIMKKFNLENFPLTLKLEPGAQKLLNLYEKEKFTSVNDFIEAFGVTPGELQAGCLKSLINPKTRARGMKHFLLNLRTIFGDQALKLDPSIDAEHAARALLYCMEYDLYDEDNDEKLRSILEPLVLKQREAQEVANESPLDIFKIPDAFTVDYIGHAHVSLIKHLSRCVQGFAVDRGKKYYSISDLIFGPTMIGKSRCVLQMQEFSYVFYLSFQPGQGFPRKSTFADAVLDRLEKCQSENQMRRVWYNYCIAVLSYLRWRIVFRQDSLPKLKCSRIPLWKPLAIAFRGPTMSFSLLRLSSSRDSIKYVAMTLSQR